MPLLKLLMLATSTVWPSVQKNDRRGSSGGEPVVGLRLEAQAAPASVHALDQPGTMEPPQDGMDQERGAAKGLGPLAILDDREDDLGRGVVVRLEQMAGSWDPA